jgi:homospermidine synthase
MNKLEQLWDVLSLSPYLGKLTGEVTDWTPLQCRGELFPEKLDVDSPWQLQNIRSQQWIAQASPG